MLTTADRIWNRAITKNDTTLLAGDLFLSSMIGAHSFVMNGGVHHAVEVLGESELIDAVEGYNYFGLKEVGELLRLARKEFLADRITDELEISRDSQYSNLIPDDDELAQRFEVRLLSDPNEFAPLE